MGVPEPEALVGGGVVGVLVVLIRDLISRLVPSSVPGAIEVQALTQRLIVAEQTILHLDAKVKNLEEKAVRADGRVDACAREINRAVGGINAIQTFLDPPERPHAVPPRR